MLKNYIATYAIDVVALILLYAMLRDSHILRNDRKKPFLYGILLTVAVILSEAGTILTNGAGARLRALNILCNVLGFTLTPLIPIALIFISEIKIRRTWCVFILPSLLNAAAAVLSPFLGLIFYVDRDNQYQRGGFFYVFVAAYIVNLTLLAVSALYNVKKYNYPIKGRLIALALFTVAGTSVQLFVPSVYSSWHCVVMALFLYYFLMSEFDSSFDTLTELYNRAAYKKILRRITGRKAFSIINLDINDFKAINDTYGHDYGDSVLKTLASILRRELDDRYICFRVGGDEFCVLSRVTDREKIESQLEKLTKALSEEKDKRMPTVAYGYRVFKGDEPMDFKKILKEADDRMYDHKKKHKAGKTK